MSENKDIVTRAIFDETVKTINKLELSTASKSKLKSIESYVAKSELKCSTPRLEEEKKKQRLISYLSGKDQGIKQQIFRDIDAMHPILKNEQNAKEIIFNLLASSFSIHNGISSYNAQLEEAVAGVLCMYELNGILDSDAEKTTIIKPKDGYCDFYVQFLKYGRMVKFGIDPFRVSEHAGFERTFLHHTNSEKRNGDDFPVIGVACLDSENENAQHEKIFELVDKYSDKELNLAIYSPQYGCKLIEFDTYKFDGSVTLTKAEWQNLR
ncbi:hypothetical protein VL10_23940 [Leclercia adecarboxylata]|nr:hypothetical protein VL10_23940 [Leclercia adecarboxylata]KMN66733.1 hypothetical protein VK95_04380 [Leclercia sp. LK8]